MVVESMIFNKKILLLGHDSKSFYNHNNFLKYVENYKGIERYSFLKVTKSLDNLEKDLVNLKKLKKVSNKKLEYKTNFFFNHDGKSYEKKLHKIIEKII